MNHCTTASVTRQTVRLLPHHIAKMRTASWISLPCLAAGIVRAAALPQPTGLQARASPVNPLGSLITDIPVLGENVADSVASILGGIGSDLQELSMAIDAFASIVTAAKPTTTTPSNTEEAHSRVSSIFAPYATSGTPNIVVSPLVTRDAAVGNLPDSKPSSLTERHIHLRRRNYGRTLRQIRRYEHHSPFEFDVCGYRVLDRALLVPMSGIWSLGL